MHKSLYNYLCSYVYLYIIMLAYTCACMACMAHMTHPCSNAHMHILLLNFVIFLLVKTDVKFNIKASRSALSGKNGLLSCIPW